MSATAKSLYNTALQLADSERTELAAWLIESLDSHIDEDVDADWDAEIGNRIEDLNSGKVSAVPWPEARRIILGLSDVPAAD